LKAVRRKELPELNDDFAKDMGDYQTLEELKDSIRKSILHEREHQAQDDTKQQIIAKLVDTHPFAVPDLFIDRQIEGTLNTQLQQLASQGIDPRSLKLDWQKIRDSQKERAERDVRASLILDKISDREASARLRKNSTTVQRYARQRASQWRWCAKLQKEGTLTHRQPDPHREDAQLPVRQGAGKKR
jgi:trigger factor